MSLAPSALASNSSGVAATVTAPGSNKAKMKDGEAVFKNVRIKAEAPGAYMLMAKSASRKVSTMLAKGYLAIRSASHCSTAGQKFAHPAGPTFDEVPRPPGT